MKSRTNSHELKKSLCVSALAVLEGNNLAKETHQMPAGPSHGWNYCLPCQSINGGKTGQIQQTPQKKTSKNNISAL